MRLLLVIITVFIFFNSESKQITWTIKSLKNNIQNFKKKINNDSYFSEGRKIFLENLKKPISKPPVKTISKVSLKSSGIKKDFKQTDDDLVVFDYTNDKKPNDEISKKEALKLLEAPEQNETNKDYVFDYSIDDSLVCRKQSDQRISHVYTNKIKVNGFNLKGSVESLQNFELSFLDDRNQIITSNTDGEAIVGGDEILARSYTGRQSIVFASGYYPLNTKLDFSHENIETNLPLIEKESLQFILSEENIPNYEGLLLIAADSQAQKISIDKNFKKRFELNEEFKIVESEGIYVLFSGIELGNVEITIENTDKSVIKNFVHLRMDEIFYYQYEKSSSERFDIEVCQKEILASQKRMLSVSGKKIEFLNNKFFGDKVSVNKYRFTKMGNLNYQKDYLIFKHLSQDIFVAPNGFGYVEVPSQNYLEYLIDTFRFNKSMCTVQLNINNEVKEIITDAYTSIGFLPIDKTALDKHGMFDSKPDADTEKVFIFGEGEGVIYNKIIYKSGSVDYIESFCGPGTYSIEQL